jgi:molybdopterin synthase catalytic subunit
MIDLTTDEIDCHALTDSVRRPSCGAVVLFLGTVRDLADGHRTISLHYEAYAGMAEKKLREIERDVRQRWPVGEISIVHRLGRRTVSEISVAVIVSCPHRHHAFEACRYALERVREIVPIWELDTDPAGGAAWVHSTAESARNNVALEE